MCFIGIILKEMKLGFEKFVFVVEVDVKVMVVILYEFLLVV